MLKTTAKTTANVLSRFSLLFAMLMLAACGGSGSSGDGTDPVQNEQNGGTEPVPDDGSDPVPDDGSDPVSDGGTDPVPDDGTDPGTVATAVKPGLFLTSITYDSGIPDQQGFALISSSGKYAFYRNGRAGTFGKLTSDGDNKFSGDGTKVFLDETWQSVDGALEGSVSASSPEEFNATFSPDTAEPDVGWKITGVRSDEVSDPEITMEDLSGIYFLSEANPTSVTIETNGTVTVDDSSSGCKFGADKISIPDPAYNIFEGTLSLSDCADIDGASGDQRDGDYPIIGYLLRFPEGAKRLVFAGTNGDVVFLFSGAN